VSARVAGNRSATIADLYRVEGVATSTNSDLWTVPIDGSPQALSRPRNITSANCAWDGAPRHSPNGRAIGVP